MRTRLDEIAEKFLAEKKCPVCWPSHEPNGEPKCNCGCHIGLGHGVTDRRKGERRKEIYLEEKR